MRKSAACVVVLAVAFAAGCYPKAGRPPGAPSANAVAWASTRWPGATAASLSQGRDHFIAKCNGCHDYPDVTAIEDDRWPKIIKRMGGKAHLTAAESDTVLQFVLAARSDQAGR